MSIADKKEMNDTIDIHCQEIEEMIGRETVKAVKSRSTKLWDWAKTVAEKAGIFCCFFIEIVCDSLKSLCGGCQIENPEVHCKLIRCLFDN